MNDVLRRLALSELDSLAKALRSGKLTPEYSATSIQPYCNAAVATEVAAGLQQLAEEGWREAQLATLLSSVADERRAHEKTVDAVELVWTGPECPGLVNRDTMVVVSELLAHAKKSVLVASYALYQGKQLFQGLAARMAEVPELEVRLFLDISRQPGDTSLDSMIAARFAQRFRTKEWPGSRLPEVWYDPRALALGNGKKACLHAKCIVVDGEVAFISSANLTEAAQQRNIEVGALIRSKAFSANMEVQFTTLAEKGVLKRLSL